jgi:hypothetical protein
MSLRLGKLPPKHDYRALYLRNYVKVEQLPALVAATNWRGQVTAPWGMDLNDQLGDCGCAGAAHLIMNVSASGAGLVVPSGLDVLAMYEDPGVGGYNPSDPSTDQGIALLDGLKYLRRVGMAGQKADAFVDINVQDTTMLKYGAQLFGGLYLGVQLPQSAMDAFDAGKRVWDDTTDTNIAGGHCIVPVDFDAGGLYCVTWGDVVLATWAWCAKYADEAHAVLFFDWMNRQGVSPAGLDLPMMEHDLQVITA